mmetsp:Transcript_10033/g.30644  ORF Transcript_10033/g.30644 Transcript_10033/m.30644 type:complete len:287 (-) Transcript_10033:1145-2005(-)
METLCTVCTAALCRYRRLSPTLVRNVPWSARADDLERRQSQRRISAPETTACTKWVYTGHTLACCALPRFLRHGQERHLKVFTGRASTWQKDDVRLSPGISKGSWPPFKPLYLPSRPPLYASAKRFTELNPVSRAYRNCRWYQAVSALNATSVRQRSHVSCSCAATGRRQSASKRSSQTGRKLTPQWWPSFRTFPACAGRPHNKVGKLSRCSSSWQSRLAREWPSSTTAEITQLTQLRAGALLRPASYYLHLLVFGLELELYWCFLSSTFSRIDPGSALESSLCSH